MEVLRKFSLTFICASFLCIYLNGQDLTVAADSLITVVDQMPDNKEKVRFLMDLSDNVHYSSPNHGRIYIDEALLLAEQIDFVDGDLWKLRGNINLMQGDYPTALEDYLKALEIYEKESDLFGITNIKNNLGILYDEQENFEESRKYYIEALEGYEELGLKNGVGDVLLNLGWLYDTFNRPDSAIVLYRQSEKVNEEFEDKRLEGYIYVNLGTAFLHKAIYDSADYYFNAGLEVLNTLGDDQAVAETYNSMSELSMIRNNSSEAMRFLDLAESISIQSNLKTELLESYRLKSKFYESVGDYKNAYLYHQTYKELSDSIALAERNSALFTLQIQRQHSDAMAALTKENEATRFKNTLLVVSSLFSLLLMLASAYYFKNRYKTNIKLQKQNEEITKQKKEIETQQRKLAEINEDLKHKNVSLKHLNKEKNYLLHVVAHDLKSPLSQMSGLSQIIKLDDHKLSKQQEECLEKIETVSDRLIIMVDKILDIDAIEQKSDNLKLEYIHLNEILTDTVDGFNNQAENKNQQFNINLNGNSLVKVDKQHTQQIFENLISNALKFSPENKNIDVSLKEVGDEIVAEVKDYGPGLTDDDKSKVFQKFQRLSAKPTGEEDSLVLAFQL